MDSKKFKIIGFLIIGLIVLVTAFQASYILKTYEKNKKIYQSEVQQALDDSVEEYYAELAKTDVITLTDNREIRKGYRDSTINSSLRIDKNSNDSNAVGFFKRLGENDYLSNQKLKQLGFLHFSDSVQVAGDTLGLKKITYKNDSKIKLLVDEMNDISIFTGKRAADSLDQIEELTSKIMISITRDTVDFNMLNKILQNELDRKKLFISYALTHAKDDSVTGQFNQEKIADLEMKTEASKTYLPRKQDIKMYYENASLIILQKGIQNILISVITIGLITFVLLYLYRIIKSQKELAAIKNDLISNITHEFKTPISTISTAIEGIQRFNPENDLKKTEKYLSISQQYLTKLHFMVEKLLETATINSEKLILKKENTDLIDLCKKLVGRFKIAQTEKQISFSSELEASSQQLDPFHFENAVANLIDNAIKYGGTQIKIAINQKGGSTLLTVSDDGGNIPDSQKDKIFDQFYRIPTGNRHEVKGFGIGLYYSKNIIEKHDASLKLRTKQNLTEFTIEFNEKN